MASEPRQRLTIPEYLAFERQSETKHDYLDGEIFAMTGASREHNRITLNVALSFETQLEERDCEVFANEMRVRTPANLLTYPDVIVVCGPQNFDDSELDTLLNPSVVVEVLYKSTEAYDRRTKLFHYQMIPSLSDVVLVAQNEIHIEHFHRQAREEWTLREMNDITQRLDLPAIECTLELKRVYRKVFV